MPLKSGSRDFQRSAPRQLDFEIIFALILSTIIFVLMPPLSTTPIGTALGIFFILFVPGYLLVAALFPGKGSLDGIERIALSFGLSMRLRGESASNKPRNKERLTTMDIRLKVDNFPLPA